MTHDPEFTALLQEPLAHESVGHSPGNADRSWEFLSQWSLL